MDDQACRWSSLPALAQCSIIQFLGQDIVTLDTAMVNGRSRGELNKAYRRLRLVGLNFPMRFTPKSADGSCMYVCEGLEWTLGKGIDIQDFFLVAPGTNEATNDKNVMQSWFLKELIARNFIAMAELFITRCPRHDFNEQSIDGSGLTPCHMAASKGEVNLLRLLCDKVSVDLNLKCSNGESPLHLAAGNGHVEIVKILCSQPHLDIDQKSTRGGETALHRSVSIDTASSESTNELLVEHGADINAINNGDMTVLDVARIHGRSSSISWLIDTGASSGAEERRRRSASL